MAAKKSKHVRRFLSAAAARLGEADYLYEGNRTVGAVYLAGYAVECVLKVLILSLLPEHKQPGMIEQFRGTKAHDFGWLKNVYRANGGAGFPKAVSEAFVIVDSWGTELRYNPGTQYPGDGDDFFHAVDVIVKWAGQRV